VPGIADLTRTALKTDPGRPLLTWYDESTGERTELSVTTWANWVAKVGSLLAEEHDLGRGDVLLVDLPAHWLGAVFLGAAWTAGITVAFPESELEGAGPDAVVCGPAGLAHWADRAHDIPVLACALLPMAVRFAAPMPPGVLDVGVEVWSQPDRWEPADLPGDDDVALALPDRTLTHAELWSAAATGSLLTGGGRLLSGANPASPPGFATLTEPLARSGSLVLVAGADADRLDAIAAAERVTHRV
jgi:uncharacterized protein (TIGR03089 family)